MIKVSVIVAVYQAEKYLTRCVQSLVNQTLHDFEVLLIDDGSKDNSGKICDDYAKRDARFKVYHKENGGVSSARQLGLDNAVGEYVIHVDPDDWIDPHMLEEMYTTAKKNEADLVLCDFFVEQSNNQQYYRKDKPKEGGPKQFFYDMITTLHGSCWNKLVKKSCFDKYKISFPQNMIMWEDKYVNLKLAENPIKVCYLPKAFYHYDCSINKESAVVNNSRKKLESEKFLISWLDKIEDPIVKEQLIELKKDAKKVAFFARDISSKEFRNLYPEINSCYKFKIKGIGRFDFFMYLALRFPKPFVRFLHSLKLIFRKPSMSTNNQSAKNKHCKRY